MSTPNPSSDEENPQVDDEANQSSPNDKDDLDRHSNDDESLDQNESNSSLKNDQINFESNKNDRQEADYEPEDQLNQNISGDNPPEEGKNNNDSDDVESGEIHEDQHEPELADPSDSLGIDQNEGNDISKEMGSQSTPQVWILREDSEHTVLTDYFTPQDLVTLIVNNTGEWKQTHVQMIDSEDQVRYNALSGGNSHKWTTRLQNTRTYGKWKFVIKGPYADSENEFTKEAHFHINKDIPIDRSDEELFVEIEETPAGYALHEEIIEEVPAELYITQYIIFKRPTILKSTMPLTLEDIIPKDTKIISIDIPELEEPAEVSQIDEFDEIEELEEVDQSEELETLEELVEEEITEIPLKEEGTPTEEVVKEVEEPPVEEIEFTLINKDLPSLEIPVSEIHGIGPSYSDRLEEQDIKYVHHFLEVQSGETEELAEEINVSQSKYENWIAEAKDIASNPEHSVYLEYKEILEEKEKMQQELEQDVDIEITNSELVDLKIPTTEIKGIGSSYSDKLSDVGIQYVHELVDQIPIKLSERIGISESKCAKWIDRARDVATNPENELYLKFLQTEEEEVVVEDVEEVLSDVQEIEMENSDLQELEIPLTELSGIGSSYSQRFEKEGIKFVDHLLPFSAQVLSKIVDLSKSRCEGWIEQAKQIANDPTNEIYQDYKKEEEVVPVEEIDQILENEIEMENEDLPELKIPLSELNGIGPSYYDRFKKEDLSFVHQILPFTKSSLSRLVNLSESRCEGWIDQAIDIANNPNNSIYQEYQKEEEEVVEVEEIDQILEKEIEMENEDLLELKIPLTELSGIGPSYSKKFAKEGINYVHEIIPFNSKSLSNLVGLSESRCEGWISQAKQIANNPDNKIYQNYQK